MKYKSELVKEIVETRGHEKSSSHYESECVEKWIEETKGSYPKLCDYEGEWLNYIVENPIGEFPYATVTDVTDATINNVVPYAYQSAILKGQTLVNLANYELSTSSSEISCPQDFSLQRNNTAYTLFNFTDKIITFNTYTTSSWRGFENVEANSKKILTLNDFTIKEVIGKASNGWDKTTETEKFLNGYMIIEGDYTNVDIPYFEGMQSVKMPVLTTIGKNLFNKEGLVLQNKKRVRADKGEFVYSTASSGFDNYFDCQFLQGKTISVSSIATGNGGEIAFYTIDKTYIKGGNLANSQLVPENAFYYRFSINVLDTSIDEAKIQIEVNSVATLYEPYKSNILSTSEEVELRGIGKVKDELNLLTGELTQRLINMNNLGDYDMPNYIEHDLTNYSSVPVLKISFDLPFKIVDSGYGATNNLPIVCDKFKILGDKNGYSVDRGSYVSTRGNQLFLHLIKEEVGLPTDKSTTKEIVKEFLKENPFEVTCCLVEPVIKTVDLSIQDQDGNTLRKIKPIEGTMYIHSNGTPLKPTFSGEIPIEAITQNLYSFIEEE